jgi:hypothetical protein
VHDLPDHVATYPIDYIYDHLQRNHGIEPPVASNRLHRIKDQNGFPANFELLFHVTGNVYRKDTREYVGSLTQGGKTAGEG